MGSGVYTTYWLEWFGYNCEDCWVISEYWEKWVIHGFYHNSKNVPTLYLEIFDICTKIS